MSDLIIRDTPITPTVSACPHCNKTNWTCTNMGDGYERLECHECGLVLWGFVGITADESAVHTWNLLTTHPAPAPVTPQEAWQDISTAPKDGTQIQVWMRGSLVPVIVYYISREYLEREYGNPDHMEQGFYYSVGYPFDDLLPEYPLDEYLTHWKSTDEPPQSGESS